MQLLLAIVFIAGSFLIGSVVPAPRQKLVQVSPNPTPEIWYTPSPPPTPSPIPTTTPEPTPLIPVSKPVPTPDIPEGNLTIKNDKTGETKEISGSELGQYGLDKDPAKIGKQIKEKYPEYSEYPDELIGTLYINKYLSGKYSSPYYSPYSLPPIYFSPYSSPYFSPSINCYSNTIGNYTYTNCF